MSEMLGVISDTERLANDLSSADLIPYFVKDEVITTNLSRYQKASKLVNEFERSLRVSNKREMLISFCEVLKKQENPAFKRIAEDILSEIGELIIFVASLVGMVVCEIKVRGGCVPSPTPYFKFQMTTITLLF